MPLLFWDSDQKRKSYLVVLVGGRSEHRRPLQVRHAESLCLAVVYSKSAHMGQSKCMAKLKVNRTGLSTLPTGVGTAEGCGKKCQSIILLQRHRDWDLGLVFSPQCVFK